MGKDKKTETSDGSSEEEYVVEKVLNKRTIKGKVGKIIIYFTYLTFLVIKCALICVQIQLLRNENVNN